MRRIPLYLLAVAIGIVTLGAQPAARPDKLKFKGNETFSLKLKEDGLKVVDEKETELARLRIEKSGEVKIKDPQDAVLGYVTGKEPQRNLIDAGRENTLFALARQPNGDLQLTAGKDKLLYTVRKGNTHAEVEDAVGKGSFRVQPKAGKTVVQDRDGRPILTTEAPIDPQTAALFVLKDLTLAQQAALWLAMEQSQKLEK